MKQSAEQASRVKGGTGHVTEAVRSTSNHGKARRGACVRSRAEPASRVKRGAGLVRDAERARAKRKVNGGDDVVDAKELARTPSDKTCTRLTLTEKPSLSTNPN